VEVHGHGRLEVVREDRQSSSGGVMNRTIKRTAASLRLDQQTHSDDMRATRVASAGGVSYRRHLAAARKLFAAPTVDLTTLVIAQEIKRKAQAERQREVLRDTAYQYDMPVSRDRNNEQNDHRNDPRSRWINPADSAFDSDE
jgi:hypothetical protein